MAQYKIMREEHTLRALRTTATATGTVTTIKQLDMIHTNQQRLNNLFSGRLVDLFPRSVATQLPSVLASCLASYLATSELPSYPAT